MYFDSVCPPVLSPLLPGAGKSPLLLKTRLIRSGMASWSPFLEILPTTKIQLKFHRLQKTLGIHSFISSFNSFLPLCLHGCPFSTSTASHLKPTIIPLQHMLFAGLPFYKHPQLCNPSFKANVKQHNRCSSDKCMLKNWYVPLKSKKINLCSI